MSTDSKTVGVIGAGTMGQGIVQVFAQNGFDVLVYLTIRAHLHADQAVSQG